MSEEEINEIVEEHYGFTVEEIDNTVGNLSLIVNQLQQENKQLKTDLEEANDNATWWRNRYNAVSKQNKLYKSVLDEMCRSWEKIDKYKSVLDEIREYINTENYKDENICVVDGIEILQILDKVNNGTSNE